MGQRNRWEPSQSQISIVWGLGWAAQSTEGIAIKKFKKSPKQKIENRNHKSQFSRVWDGQRNRKNAIVWVPLCALGSAMCSAITNGQQKQGFWNAKESMTDPLPLRLFLSTRLIEHALPSNNGNATSEESRHSEATDQSDRKPCNLSGVPMASTTPMLAWAI